MSELMRKILYYENILEFKENTQSPLQLNEVKNWQLCRTCLLDPASSTSNQDPGFVRTNQFIDFKKMCVMGMDGDLLNVPNMLAEATGLKIPDQDRLPVQICKECLNKITTLYFFKLHAKRAEDVLKRLRCKLDEAQASPVTGKATPNKVETTINEADCVKTGGLPAELLKRAIAITEDAVSCNTNSTIEIASQEIEIEEQEAKLEPDFDQYENQEELIEIEEDVVAQGHEEESVDQKFEYEQEQIVTSEQDFFVDELQELVEDDEESCATEDATNQMLSSLKNYKVLAGKNILQPKAEIEVQDASEVFDSTDELPKRKTPKLFKALLESLTCELCDKSFKVQHLLRKHVQQDHPNAKAFKCRVCGKMFAHMQSLSRHMQTHKPLHKKNVCDYCGKAFQRSEDCKRHRRIHTGERPYTCVFCPKAFKQNSELREHQHTHLRHRMYECDICGHRLSSRNGLYVHKKSHDGVKKFVCVSCDKRFMTNGELKSHIKVHSKEHSVEE